MPTMPKLEVPPNWTPSFPLDNLKRQRAQSLKNLLDPPSLEEAERILAEDEQTRRAGCAPAWWRRFARSAGEPVKKECEAEDERV